MALALAVDAAHAQSQSREGAPSALHWPETLTEAQAANRLPAKSLETLLNGLRVAESPPLQIGEFRFAPMVGPGMCLVATVDASGRQMVYAVAVVCPERSKGAFRMTVLPSAPPHLLGAELLDLDGDGAFELVTRELVGEYDGAQTLPLYWYSVFRVQNSVPHDASARYRRFYDDRLLPEIQFVSRLVQLSGQPPERRAAEILAKTRFLSAKYERRIAGVADAGFTDAVEWSKSDNPHVQMLAVETLRDMDSLAALEKLKKLEKAANPAVSSAASRAVQARMGVR